MVVVGGAGWWCWLVVLAGGAGWLVLAGWCWLAGAGWLVVGGGGWWLFASCFCVLFLRLVFAFCFCFVFLPLVFGLLFLLFVFDFVFAFLFLPCVFAFCFCLVFLLLFLGFCFCLLFLLFVFAFCFCFCFCLLLLPLVVASSFCFVFFLSFVLPCAFVCTGICTSTHSHFTNLTKHKSYFSTIFFPKSNKICKNPLHFLVTAFFPLKITPCRMQGGLLENSLFSNENLLFLCFLRLYF